MPYETLRPLSNALITYQRQLVAEVAFCLDDIPTTIRVRVYRDLESERFSSEQSHYIQTPLQNEPIFELADDHPSVEACLRTISDAMAEQYRRAEAAGHTPTEDWLLPSRDFD